MTGIPPELFIEGIAHSFSAYLENHPELTEKLLDRMAELHCELMTPKETADMIGITTDTLRENWQKYGLRKSMRFGHNEPRYFRSQVIEAAQAEDMVLNPATPRLKAKRTELEQKKITPFPRRSAPTVPVAAKGGARTA